MPPPPPTTAPLSPTPTAMIFGAAMQLRSRKVSWRQYAPLLTVTALRMAPDPTYPTPPTHPHHHHYHQVGPGMLQVNGGIVGALLVPLAKGGAGARAIVCCASFGCCCCLAGAQGGYLTSRTSELTSALLSPPAWLAAWHLEGDCLIA